MITTKRANDSPVTFVTHGVLPSAFGHERRNEKKKDCPTRGVVNKLLERLRFTFTPNRKREFVPRDQVFPLVFVYCQVICDVTAGAWGKKF